MPVLSDNIPNSMLALLIGPAGCGKTTFALQFRNPYLVNIDNNIAGPRNYYKRVNFDMSKLKYDNVARDDKDNPIPVAAQYQRFTELLARGVADKDVSTLIIDSTTSLQPVLETHIRIKKGKPEGFKFTFDEWADFKYIWSETMLKLRVCGKSVIIIGHEKVEKGQVDEVLRYVLAVPGQTGELMPMLMTDVWRMSVENKLVGNMQQPAYFVSTIQSLRHPNIKTSLTLPQKFEANTTSIKMIEDQIYETPTTNTPTK